MRMLNLRVLLLLIIPAISFGQTYQRHVLQKDRLSIKLSEGVLELIPVSEKAIRVRWNRGIKEEREFILVNKLPVPVFKVSESGSKLVLKTSAVTASFDKNTSNIEYSDRNGNVFLREKVGSRKLKPDTVAGQSCFVAEQGFDSPNGEYLFGLGQFQDGNYNLKNVTRKLTQVNTQIAIPFLYSSRGFGILWHQYGITEFNPSDNLVALSKKDSATGDGGMVEVTTTAGTQRVSRMQALYVGKIQIPADGEYSVMLDLGNMESRHLLVIDGKPYIDQSNQWLPPAAGKIITLKAGAHNVQVLCKAANVPRLSWKAVGNETVFRSIHAKDLDYVVFAGKNADDVISNYRNISGTVPMLPLWAYGFWQCRERYTSGNHLVQTIEEFRKRNLPVDVIVQDWQYWGKNGWGVPEFDTANYPNPAGFIKRLHDLNARFSISVWENLDKKSNVAKEYISKDLYIPNSPWIDIYKPETQKTHWNALNKNLFSLGVDSWWMDATEPENDALVGKQTNFGPGEFYRLTYPLFVSEAVYNGQRATDPSKRVTTLTRSAFPSQQRFGTINWSGDIGWNWDTYKRHIVAGLNYSLTGMPYWTTDIGGFFRPGRTQYTDPKYHDILTRWFQWSTFVTIFRMHGYQTETEPWKYGDTVMNNMRSMMNLRYRLMPYIYSEGWQISRNNSTMMRPMIMDFSKDPEAVAQAYQYMFGKSFLVAPVTAPEVSQWDIYLPKTSAWFDFWTGKRFTGGQTIKTAAPQNQIPLFVKAGSIVPMGRIMQYTSEKMMDTLEIRVYPGADGQFDLYSDEGDNYNYEKGKYTMIPFKWNEKQQTLTIDKQQGDYVGSLKKQVLNIVWVNEAAGFGEEMFTSSKPVIYTGQKLTVSKK